MNTKAIQALCLLLVLTASQSLADILDHWSQRSALAAGRVRYCGGLFVAVGDGGLIATSSNGAVWTVRDSGTTAYLRSAAYSGGWFVAVGNNAIVVSRDVTNWTRVALTNQCDLFDVSPGGYRFVAVGQPYRGWSSGGPNVFYSVPFQIFNDPTNWAAVKVAFRPGQGSCYYLGETNTYFSSVVAAGGRLVAVGDICTGIWTSSNGRDWTYRQNAGTHISAVAFGNDRLVTIGFEGPPWHSIDYGLKWTNSLGTTNPPSAPYDGYIGNDIVFGDGKFVVVGTGSPFTNNRVMFTTTNGVDWEARRDDGCADTAFHSIAYGNGVFVAASRCGLYQSDTLAGRLLPQPLPNSSDAFQFSTAIDPGTAFRVEASSNLLDWMEVWRSTNNGTLSSTQFVDFSITNSSRRFYRSVVP